jgi:uncharacterized protein (DUF58 family)
MKVLPTLPKALSAAAKPLPPPPYVAETQIRRLAVQISSRLDGLLQGEHTRAQLGPGSESAEARLYGVGDDARRIDWAATARTGQTHTRSTTADHELETTVLIDLTASMAFGTRRSEKRDLALAVGAGLVHLTSRHGDRVGALILTPSGIRRVPARGGRDAAMALQHVLTSTPRVAEGSGASLADALSGLMRPPLRRGLLVVLSDLIEPGAGTDVPTWARPLRLLTLRSDVVVCQVQDPREAELPDVGTLQVVDPETGRLLEVRTTRTLRERYAAAAAERTARHQRAARQAGAGYVLLRTDRDWLPELARSLSNRRPRAASLGAVHV